MDSKNTFDIKTAIQAEIDAQEVVKAQAIIDFFMRSSEDQLLIWKAALVTVAKHRGKL